MAGEMIPYWEILSQLGGSDSARVNLLQDLGVSFGPQEQYVPEAAPSWTNPVGLQYAGDPVAASIFNEIEKGTPPAQAVQKAMDAGLDVPELDSYTGNVVDPTKPNYWDIAGQYANKKAELDVAKMDFDAKQTAARQQYEQDRPLTMQDLVNPPTQYELAQQAYGKELTPQSLLSEYQISKRQAMPVSKVESAFKDLLPFNVGASGSSPIPLHQNAAVSKMAEDMLLGTLQNGQRQGGKFQSSLDQMKQRVSPAAGVQDVLSTLAALSRLGKD